MKENKLREILRKVQGDTSELAQGLTIDQASSQIIDLMIGKVKSEINSVIAGLKDTSDMPDKDYNQGLEMARKAILSQLKTILKGLK